MERNRYFTSFTSGTVGRVTGSESCQSFRKTTGRASLPCRTFKTFQKSHLATGEALLNKQGSKWNIWDFIPSSTSSGETNSYRNLWGDEVNKFDQICTAVALTLCMKSLLEFWRADWILKVCGSVLIFGLERLRRELGGCFAQVIDWNEEKGSNIPFPLEFNENKTALWK